MRRFLIRLVQVFALAIIGTGFLVDTSFAGKVDVFNASCTLNHGTPFRTFMSVNGLQYILYSCLYPSSGGSVSASTCSSLNGVDCENTYYSRCNGRPCEHTPLSFWDEGKKPKPSRRNGDIVTAGTCADRGLCPRGRGVAPTLGAPVNGMLNAAAPSRTAPAASTGAALNTTGAAALNTQATTGLTGIDKSLGIPSQLSDHLSRMRR